MPLWWHLFSLTENQSLKCQYCPFGLLLPLRIFPQSNGEVDLLLGATNPTWIGFVFLFSFHSLDSIVLDDLAQLLASRAKTGGHIGAHEVRKQLAGPGAGAIWSHGIALFLASLTSCRWLVVVTRSSSIFGKNQFCFFYGFIGFWMISRARRADSVVAINVHAGERRRGMNLVQTQKFQLVMLQSRSKSKGRKSSQKSELPQLLSCWTVKSC